MFQQIMSMCGRGIVFNDEDDLPDLPQRQSHVGQFTVRETVDGGLSIESLCPGGGSQHKAARMKVNVNEQGEIIMSGSEEQRSRALQQYAERIKPKANGRRKKRSHRGKSGRDDGDSEIDEESEDGSRCFTRLLARGIRFKDDVDPRRLHLVNDVDSRRSNFPSFTDNDEDAVSLLDSIPHWCRAVFITCLATCVAGLIPGQALFVRILSDYGVYRSVCEAGQQTCVGQNDSVTAAFDLIRGVSYVSTLPVGYLFDRFGGRAISLFGACSTVLGVLLMEIPLLGVTYGYDSYTSHVLAFALCFTDVGNLCSQYCVLTLIYHFRRSQMLLLGFQMVQIQICTRLPDAFLHVQRRLQIDLPEVFGLFAILTFTAGICLYIVVPTQMEFFKNAMRFTVARWPDSSDTFLSDIARTSKSMGAYCQDHVVLCFAITALWMLSNVYTSLLGEYTEMLWSSHKMGDDMVALCRRLPSTVGVIVAILVCIGSDNAGQGALYVTSFVILLLLMLLTFNIMGNDYFQQITCVICSTVLSCLTIPLSIKYCVIYSPPSQLGTYIGLLWTIVIFGSTFAASDFLRYATEATTAAQLGFEMMIVMILSTFLFTVWAVRQFTRGLPRRPPLVHEEAWSPTLSQAFL